jgi:HEPN domain-containing protein
MLNRSAAELGEANCPSATAHRPSRCLRFGIYSASAQGFSDKCCIFRKTDEVLNTGKQIEYWIISAKSDLDAAELLIRESKFIHGLFFCHLAIEKGLKAHVVKVTADIPPKSHNLIYLLGLSNIEFEERFEDFLGILMKYQLEGRYPDYNPVIPTKDKVVDYLNKTKEMLIWIEKKL